LGGVFLILILILISFPDGGTGLGFKIKNMKKTLMNLGTIGLAWLNLQTITPAQDATPPAQGLENIL
jgi:hypothetical protein